MKLSTAIRATFLIALLASLTLALAQTPQPQQPTPDNPRASQPDQSAAQQPSADPQKGASNDRDLTKQVKKAIADDKSLAGANVKVSVQNGQVTLKGTVKSDEEKRAAEAAATAIAGAGKVTNELQVSAQK